MDAAAKDAADDAESDDDEAPDDALPVLIAAAVLCAAESPSSLGLPVKEELASWSTKPSSERSPPSIAALLGATTGATDAGEPSGAAEAELSWVGCDEAASAAAFSLGVASCAAIG